MGCIAPEIKGPERKTKDGLFLKNKTINLTPVR